jgi:FixJ family two-component response regulator
MLRADPRHDAAGNILITGSPELSTTVHAMQNGYHDVLSKDDITAEHLKTAIQSAVSQAAGSAPASMSRQQFLTGMREAMSHPDMHGKLGRILSDQLAADQERLDPGYEPLLQSFLEEDEFIFDLRRSK